MLIRKIGILMLTFLIGCYLIFAYIPVILIGPAPLYFISNHDSIHHNITVEIFDEQNQTIFLKNYTLNPDESVRFKRTVNWDVPFTSSFVIWSKGIFTFNFTVDGNIKKDFVEKVNQFSTIMVSLYTFNPRTNEIIPIDIVVVSI